MDSKKRSKTSKFLSYVLRHDPVTIGLSLDSQGWASIYELLELSNDKEPRLIDEVSTNFIEVI